MEQPPNPKKRRASWRRNLHGDCTVPIDAPSIAVGQSGRPAGGSGPARTVQLKGAAAAAAAAAGRRAAGVDGAQHDDATMHDEPSERTEHYLKASSRQAAWKELMPELRAKYYHSLPANITRAQQQAETRRGQLQMEVDESWTAHTCSKAELAGSAEPAPASLQPDGQVTYYGLDCVFTLTLPKWTCQCCHQSFTPHALAFGCFPSTPVTPHVWYDLKVLQLYKKLGPGEGLSATGFLSSLSSVHEYWSGVSKDLVTSKFEDTFCAFLTMDHELESLHSLGVGGDTGPFGNCPICAHGPEAEVREELQGIKMRSKVLDLAAAMTRFNDHTLRGKGVQGPDEWKADYVELITKKRELASLRGGDAGLAVVNSAMASLLLVKAYSKEAEKNEKALFALEQTHSVSERWQPESAAYQLGLDLLRKRNLMSLEERISLAVREIQDKRVQKLAAGPSTKLGQSLKRTIGSRKATMIKHLDERSMWLVVGTEQSVEEHQLSSEAVKKLLQTGDGPWELGAGNELYWGKLANRCTADLARCTEELPDLGVQKMRLGRWAGRTLSAVEERLGQVGEGSGKGILLRRWKSLLERIIQQLDALKW